MATQFNIDGSIFDQSQRYQIEGIIYIIKTRYNPRDGWYLAFYDQNNNPIFPSSWKVMPGRALTTLFNGSLGCIDTEPTAGEAIITKDNFGFDKRFQIVFVSEEEIRELRGL